MRYASVGGIKNKNICGCAYVWCVCIRVSWEEFTEIGKNGCFWKGNFFFTPWPFCIFWIFSHVHVLTPLHTHSGRKCRKGALGPRSQTFPLYPGGLGHLPLCPVLLLPLAGHWFCLDWFSVYMGDFGQALAAPRLPELLLRSKGHGCCRIPTSILPSSPLARRVGAHPYHGCKLSSVQP